MSENALVERFAGDRRGVVCHGPFNITVTKDPVFAILARRARNEEGGAVFIGRHGVSPGRDRNRDGN